MTIKETVSVFAILSAAYPYFYKSIRNDDEQTKIAVALWHEMLADYDINTVKVALKRLIAVHKEYPPTIGQLLESIMVVNGNAAPDADEVWSEITDALGRYGLYGTNEAMTQFTPLALAAVKALGWSTLCLSETPEANRAHFLRIYPTIKARHEQRHILPKDVRAFIAARVEEQKALTQSVPLPAAIPHAVESCNIPAKQKERPLISLKEILMKINHDHA